MASINILSTKCLSTGLIEQAARYGIRIHERDFIAVQFLPVPVERISSLMNENKNVVFTSSNAVRALEYYLENQHSMPGAWSVYCLSGKTKDAIEYYAGLLDISATAQHAKELSEIIVAKGVREIVFFCGNRRREELPSLLGAQGVQVHEVIVYETEETPTPVEQSFDAILFFSPSAVHSFFSMNKPNPAAICFAVGQTTANTIAGFCNNELIVAEEPSQENMIRKLITYFQNIQAGNRHN